MAPLILHVVGARPNLPKLAPVLRALRDHPVRQLVVHTGQHYDDELSGVFFRELAIPGPDVNLGVGPSGAVGQTAEIMTALEDVLTSQRPDLVVVYGDVNSALAATLAAVLNGIEVAHVEAGLRSFDPSMPEEINRVIVDRVATVLMATSADAVQHLQHEGVAPDRIHLVGNPMIDTLVHNQDRIAATPRPGPTLGGRYAVATLHRPSNVDTDTDADELGRVLREAADQVELVVPLHPRGRAQLQRVLQHPRIHVIDPLGYLEFLSLVRGAALVITDSGGVQEETTVLGVPCLTLRDTTERPVTLTAGTNRLVTRQRLTAEVSTVLAAGRPQHWPVPPLWDGRAGERIASLLADWVLAGSEADRSEPVRS